MPQRFLQEESATLEAMKALLQGRAPPVAKGTVQPICDEQVEKPQRVTGCQWVGKMKAPQNGGWKLFKTGAFGNLVDVFLVCFPTGALF